MTAAETTLSDNVVPLSEPIHLDGRTYTSLTLRGLKVKDLIAMDLLKGSVQRSVAMYASMCGVPFPVLREMSADDYSLLMEKARPFLGSLGEAIALGLLGAEQSE